uniref:Retrotransposon gag domain-containing protein n=1 Tax=Anopheles epiroticus TaxID=199890 RepID=A0A182PWR7_9DIPT
FNGNPRNLPHFILDVEEILELFKDFKESCEYYLIIKTIRRKIKGEANDILVTNNTPTEWFVIKEVLCLFYSDKRDLMTLDHQLKSTSRMRNESIESYYSRITELITLISSAIKVWQKLIITASNFKTLMPGTNHIEDGHWIQFLLRVPTFRKNLLGQFN